jgi:hypothetical protein
MLVQNGISGVNKSFSQMSVFEWLRVQTPYIKQEGVSGHHLHPKPSGISANRLQVKLSPDKVAQLVSDIATGSAYPAAFQDLSTWPRELCCVWTANGKSVICALTDWCFKRQACA